MNQRTEDFLSRYEKMRKDGMSEHDIAQGLGLTTTQLRETELRIYQMDDILIPNLTEEDIARIIDKIISFDEIINRIKEEEQ